MEGIIPKPFKTVTKAAAISSSAISLSKRCITLLYFSSNEWSI
ncbi:MAG: hypothetical protein ABSE83_09360 [Methanobacterium sp.]